MEWKCRHYTDLTLDELYALLALRSAVFVVEQHCPYQDIDGLDRESWHLFALDGSETVACLRFFRKADEPGTAQLGRVATARRGVGLGGELLRRGVEAVRETLAPAEIYLEAQCYAAGFYAREGFTVCSEPFDEDGIPHVQMRLRMK